MSIELNRIIIPARSKWASATFLASILDVPAGPQRGLFVPVQVSNAVTLDYATRSGPAPITVPSWSAKQSSTPRTRASAAPGSPTTPGRITSSPARSATCAAAGAFTSTTLRGHHIEIITRPSPAKTPYRR